MLSKPTTALYTILTGKMNQLESKKSHNDVNDEMKYIKAVRLYNTPDGGCDFEIGKIPTVTPMDVTTFWVQNHVDKYEKAAHPAPRRQYVVTLKGSLEFKVTNGKAFLIEPGIILIAEDTTGQGHTWELIKGETWERLYIPLAANAENHFIADY
ncbi:hypothetical protein SAMN03003324_01278 [Pedobacter antarcticus]|uniref:Cupin domain-containing protein n=2 Tax=Pedobacter antarcticus TaxID=34086 RepID=A0A1I2D022_9SPHI|nr:hypothetical protein SAMN03003324_01278 [Pedobacter antarcticus]